MPNSGTVNYSVTDYDQVTAPELIVIVYFTGAPQVFAQEFFMACLDVDSICGGPPDSTYTIVMRIYFEEFVNLNMGYGAAVAAALFAVIAAVTEVNARLHSYEIGC